MAEVTVLLGPCRSVANRREYVVYASEEDWQLARQTACDEIRAVVSGGGNNAQKRASLRNVVLGFASTPASWNSETDAWFVETIGNLFLIDDLTVSEMAQVEGIFGLTYIGNDQG